jgi:hypothetical protein
MSLPSHPGASGWLFGGGRDGIVQRESDRLAELRGGLWVLAERRASACARIRAAGARADGPRSASCHRAGCQIARRVGKAAVASHRRSTEISLMSAIVAACRHSETTMPVNASADDRAVVPVEHQTLTGPACRARRSLGLRRWRRRIPDSLSGPEACAGAAIRPTFPSEPEWKAAEGRSTLLFDHSLARRRPRAVYQELVDCAPADASRLLIRGPGKGTSTSGAASTFSVAGVAGEGARGRGWDACGGGFGVARIRV